MTTSSASLKLASPSNYTALTTETVCTYLAGIKSVAAKLGGAPENWQAREVGDGNLNLVFIVTGPQGAVVAKQALPYVRLVGESWPLPLDRAWYEYEALAEQTKHAPRYVPALYHHDHDMALTVMEYLSPHIIARKGLIKGVKYPSLARHIGEFLAHTLFSTSDLALDPVTKRGKVAAYLTNTAMCKISEDLIFDEPYYAAPLNRHTAPQLDETALAFRRDTELKLAVQELKNKFLNNAEALLHGDLHTGSVMVTDSDTRVIDPEFAFFGPMGFDVGAFLANLFLAYFAQEGHQNGPAYAAWILEQAQETWDTFAGEFSKLWNARTGGELYNPRLYADSPALQKEALEARLQAVFEDTLGFAGCKMIRRILGLAHVEDLESIENPDTRAICEKKALAFGRRLVLERGNFASLTDVIKAATA
ncbi:MAG: S-methyl-5-thioribose kinase [Alphaproteobacteria bacterium]|nr:S-methyl-5-thioribose kinase [Alphaproteobacteria bacterium]